MTRDGGQNFLRSCLYDIDSSLDVDGIFCYKYANRKHASDYQTDEYTASLTTGDKKLIMDGVPFVIVCFLHLDIFVAWHKSIGFGKEKYSVPKHDLVSFENNPLCDYQERIIGKTDESKVYIFRNQTGFNKFYQNAVSALIKV